MFSKSAIGQHLLDNPMCTKNYSDKKFTDFSFGRSSFHLSALGALYIKSCKPNLCRQKEFVYNLKILRPSNHLRSASLENQFNFSFLHSDVYLLKSVG